MREERENGEDKNIIFFWYHYNDVQLIYITHYYMILDYFSVDFLYIPLKI